MSRYSRRQRSRRKWLFFWFLVICFVCAWVYGPQIWQAHRFLDADAIYENSILKDSSFEADVKEIEYDEMSAYFLEEHSTPIISISFIFKNSGAANEAPSRQGLTAILAEMLLHGAGKYDSRTFTDLSEEYGIKIDFSSESDDFGGYLIMPSANKAVGSELLKLIFTAPHFDEDYLSVTKKQMQTMLALRKEKPSAQLNDKFNEIIFAGHPYARPAGGTVKSIEAVSADDLRLYMQKYLTRDVLVIGIAGDINQDEAEKLLHDIFAVLPEAGEHRELPKLELEFKGKSYDIIRDYPQALSRFAVSGTYRQSLDFYPLYIANQIFGGSGLSSRLSAHVREKEGLTYGIYTYLTIRDAVALVEGSFSSTPENFTQAKEILLREWHKMAAEGVSQEELHKAKEAMLASNNLRFASIDGIADILVAMQRENLGIDFLQKRNDYVRAVTLEEVNAAAAKYFRIEPDFVNIGITKKGD